VVTEIDYNGSFTISRKEIQMKNIFRLVPFEFLFGVFCLFTSSNPLHAQWIQTNTSFTNTSFWSLAVSPNGTGGTNLFAGTSGSVFLSTNNGANWTSASTGLTTTGVFALASSPNGTGGTNIFAGTMGSGVFLSTNNGANWTAVNSGFGLPANDPVTSFAISGTNIFAGTGGGVLLSTNNGSSWTPTHSGPGNTTALVVNGTDLYAATYNGVFYSSDNGTSWTAVSTGLTNTSVRSLAISPNGAGGTNLFAGTDDGVFLSTNKGTGWSAASTGLTNTHVQALVVSGTNLFAGTSGSGVFLSTNNGTSWTVVNDRSTAFTVVSAFAVTGTNLFAAIGNPSGSIWRIVLSYFSALSPPTLNSPLSGELNRPLSPSLYWSGDSAAFNYRLQVSKDSLFTLIISDDSTITTNSKRVGPLTSNTAYYWRVKGLNLAGSSQWSATSHFMTREILSPSVISPANGSLNQPLSPTLSWTAGVYPSIYHLQVATDSTFSSPVFDNSSLAATSKQIVSLLSNTEYYWRVATIDSGNISFWSATWNFTTHNVFPPLLVSPSDNSVNQPLSPTLSWNAAPYVTVYHLQVATDSTFSSPVFDNSSLAATSKQIVSLLSNTEYYWRVATIDSGNTSSWSATWHFTTHDVFPPILVSPSDNSVNQPLSPTLSWNAALYVTAYHLQVATDSTFSSPVFDNSSITATSKQVSSLVSNTEYYWRVATIDSGNISSWSATWHFTTLVLSPTGVVASVGNRKVVLNWQPSSSPDVFRYKIYRATSSPASTLHDSTTSTAYTDSSLTNDTQYFYRITAENTQFIEGPFSLEVTGKPFNQAPHANSLNSIYQPNSGAVLSVPITFSSLGSFDPDGTVDSIFWYVDGKLMSQQSQFTYDFAQGTKNVMLMVEDNQGGKDTSLATVNRSMFKVALNGPVYAGPSLLGTNVLYVIGTGDAVYRMDADGSVLYSLQVGGEIRSSSSIAYDTTVYIASSDKNLYAFSRNGTSLWPALPLGAELSATATIDSAVNRIYIGVANGNFVAVDRTTGKVVWNYFADAAIRNSAVITLDRKLVFATEKGTVYGIDLNNLTLPVSPGWQLSLLDSITDSPAIDGQGNIYVGTKNGRLLKISLQTQQPQVLWQVQTGGPIVASPVIDVNGNLYVGSTDAKLYAVNTSTGTTNWTFSTSQSIRSTAAISNTNLIYFGNDAGEFFVVDSNATPKWFYKDSSAITAPVLYQNGVAFIGTVGKKLIAFYDNADSTTSPSSDKQLPKQAVAPTTRSPMWGTFQGNNQRTGVPLGKMITAVTTFTVAVPTEYSLDQNYPNPFNPSTTLGYGIPMNGRVRLKIYDVLGQEVAELVNGEQAAGWYRVQWSANVSTGIYFYRIEAVSTTDPNNRFVQVKKMMLLK
jgi:outer membrane protein assembly factor BamB